MLWVQWTTRAQKKKKRERRKRTSASTSCPRVAWTRRLEGVKGRVGSREAMPPVREQRSECEGREVGGESRHKNGEGAAGEHKADEDDTMRSLPPFPVFVDRPCSICSGSS